MVGNSQKKSKILLLMWGITYIALRRCHEKISEVSNYGFFTLLHEWVDKGQTLVRRTNRLFQLID